MHYGNEKRGFTGTEIDVRIDHAKYNLRFKAVQIESVVGLKYFKKILPVTFRKIHHCDIMKL